MEYNTLEGRKEIYKLAYEYYVKNEEFTGGICEVIASIINKNISGYVFATGVLFRFPELAEKKPLVTHSLVFWFPTNIKSRIKRLEILKELSA